MNVEYKQVIMCSAVRFADKLKYYGKADVIKLSLLNLILKTLDNEYITLSFDSRRHLELLAADIQTNNSDICTVADYSQKQVAVTTPINNNAPTITDISIAYNADFYTITVAELTSTFSDVDGDSPETIRIITAPVNGDLLLNGTTVITNNTYIDIVDITSLTFTRTNDLATTDLFTFSISDDNTINKLYSNMANFNIQINQVINQPPDNVGALTLSIDSQATHQFTVANFTTETTPIYSDPDGDAMEAIKFTSLPSPGILYLSGTEITVNQIIASADIPNITYVSDPLDTVGYVDNFTFSLSDVGSHGFTVGGTVGVTVGAYVNQPATIGDGSLQVDEGVLITFTRVDFTSNTTPPYYDPEGDIADKLKITVLPATGAIKLNGTDILANDIINFTDIDAGLLTYTQAASAGGTIPTFTFEIADAGSGIFVG